MTTTSSAGSSTASTASTATTSAPTTAAEQAAALGSQLATALGGGTGIDMTNLASEVANAEFAGQISSITTQQSTLTTQISEASQLMSDLNTLASSFNTQIESGDLSSTPSVADSSVAIASLPIGENGAASSYNLEVDSLASPQVVTSPAFSSATASTGSGSLTFNFGTIASGTFTADASQTPVTVTIASGATLSDVAQDINGSGAGVTAYVATTASGAQLVIKGQQGADNAFTVSATEASGDPGLSDFNWDPAATSSSQLSESATDASYQLDGVAMTSPNNNISSAAPGLSLQLTGTNVGNPTTITYSDPSSNITSAMSEFTTALNAIVTEVQSDMAPGTGALRSDLAAQNVQNQLAELPGVTVMPDAASGAPATLADLGLSVNEDGSFALDSTVLTAALQANPSGVAAMFTTGISGIYNTLDNLVTSATSSGDPGSLTYSVNTYTADQTTLTTQLTALQTQESALQTQLTNQYAAANAEVATDKSTMSFLTAQIASWTYENVPTSSG